MSSEAGAALPLFEEAVQRVLCVVAHPDDMEYGGSAAVAEWAAHGVEVSYLLLTAGEAGIRGREPAEVAPLRAAEQQRACEVAGVADLQILDLPDGLLQADLTTRAHIARHIRRVRPDVIMCTTWALETPWGLNHADHRAAGVATVDAIRDADNPWLFRGQLTSEGLTPWATTWLLVAGAEPTHALPLSASAVEKGIASLAAHEEYLAALPEHPTPEDLVSGVCREGGASAGIEYALPVRTYRM